MLFYDIKEYEQPQLKEKKNKINYIHSSFLYTKTNIYIGFYFISKLKSWENYYIIIKFEQNILSC